MQEVAADGAFVNVILARWHGPSSTFSSITCGAAAAAHTAAGNLTELDTTEHPALGSASPRAGSRSTDAVWRLVSACCWSPTGSWTAAPATASPSDSTACAQPWRAP